MIITIDGPVASGKSTIGRMLAKRLGSYYIYSGLLFRGLAYYLINHAGYKEDALYNPSKQDIAVFLNPERTIYRYDDQFQERIFFDGQDITPFLKDSFIDKAASIVSTNENVRDALRDLQRAIARDFDVVVDGRDSGSVVFPGADFKLYLTAAVEKRAERWQGQQRKRGNEVSLKQAIETITARDKRDKDRAIAPLRIPDGAIVIDNSDLDQNETLEKVLEYIYKISSSVHGE